jgi:hypothetical protein
LSLWLFLLRVESAILPRVFCGLGLLAAGGDAGVLARGNILTFSTLFFGGDLLVA